MKRVLRLFLLFTFMALGANETAAQESRATPMSQAQANLSYASVVKKTAPAVVNIYTRKLVRQRVFSPFANDPFFQHFFGGGTPRGLNRQRLENSLGSGVLVRGDGLVVTSNHVIAGADEITVVLADRREFEATAIARDEKSDLAILKIVAKRGETFPFLELADSDAAEVGDMVLAIGNPFGVGQTVTSGIISALARTTLDINDINYYIQTDAAINPGNSGGALVGMDGRLMGINAAIYSKSGGNMGLGFAVPSNMVRSVIGSTEKDGAKPGRFVRPWMGLRGVAITADMASSLGMDRPSGFLIKSLHAASPAARAGLKIGDAVVSVGGKEVDDFAAFSYRIATMPVGAATSIGFWRDGKTRLAQIALIAPPEVPARDALTVQGSTPLTGATLVNASPAVVEEYGLDEDMERGVVVARIDEGSPADTIGLQKGDVIVALGETPLAHTRDVEKATARETGRRGWRLSIRRREQTLSLIIGGGMF